MEATRSPQDKADSYVIRFAYYDNGMTMFDGELVSSKVPRQEAEKLIRADLHSLAESFRLTPQS